MTAERRAAILSLAFVSILHGMNHAYAVFLSPLNDEMRQYFGAETISTITSFKATYLAVYAVSNLVFGFLTNRTSARLALSIGGMVNGAAVAAYALTGSTGIASMHTLWALAGIGGGTYHPVANALITGLFPERKGWALGITGLGAATGFTIGPLVTRLLIHTTGLGWQGVSVVFGMLGLVCSAAVLWFVTDLPKHPSNQASAPENAAREAGGAVPIAAFVGFMAFVISVVVLREAATWSIVDVSDFYLTNAYQGRVETAWYLFILFVPGIVVQPWAGAFSDKVGRSRLAALALALHSSGTILILLVPYSLLFAAYIVLGVGQAASVPTIEALIADYAPPTKRGIIFGVLVTCGIGFGALGPLLSGLLIDGLGRTLRAYRICLILLAALTGGAAVLMAFANAVTRKLGLQSEKM